MKIELLLLFVLLTITSCKITILSNKKPIQNTKKSSNSSSSFTKISQLQEISGSGDSYPQYTPIPKNRKILENKNVLFIFSHGVEDHEMYYQHQYFFHRGASITYGCPQLLSQSENPDGIAILSDFFKPTYKIKCQDIQQLDFNLFDAIFIPGGLPSSTALRKSDAPQKIYQFWKNPENSNKLLAVICSGSEVLIDAGIIKELPGDGTYTGSPASAWSHIRYLESQDLPTTRYQGTNTSAPDTYVYPSDGSSSNLVIGRNPMASPNFTVQISRVWLQQYESIPVDNITGIKLNLTDQQKYNYLDFQILADDTDLQTLPFKNKSNSLGSSNFSNNTLVLSGLNISIAVSSGASYQEAFQIYDSLTQIKANVTILCPSWVPTYKQGKVFLFADPPTTSFGYFDCRTGFDAVLQQNYSFDILIVPGGQFSTNGVLRNDGELQKIISNHLIKNKKVLAVSGSGFELLIPDKLFVNNLKIPYENFECLQDASYSGYQFTQDQLQIYQDQEGRKIVFNNQLQNIKDFIEMIAISYSKTTE